MLVANLAWSRGKIEGWMEEPTPHFLSVEAVENFAGFDIPHLRDLSGWRLAQVDLLPNAEAPASVALTYRSEIEDPLLPPSPSFLLEVPSPATNIDLPDDPEPVAGEGAPRTIYLAGKLAMLQTNVLMEERGPTPEMASAVVQWRVDGRSLTAKALVREDSAMFGEGFSLDLFLAVLERIS